MIVESVQVSPETRPRIAALINAHSLAIVGTRRALIDAAGELRTARYIPAAAEMWIAGTDDHQLAGHAFSFCKPPHVVVEFGITIDPCFRREGFAEILLGRVENNANSIGHLFPPGARIVFQTIVLEADTDARNLLAAGGYAITREWVHFELTLSTILPINVPDGVNIRVMDPRRDWPAVGAAMDDAFADHWGEMGAHVRTLMEPDEGEVDPVASDEGDDEDDPYSNSFGLCFVAEEDGEVIGSCLCNERTVEWPDSGKLGSLSVRRDHRRRGVGQALVATALAEFHRRDIRRVITDTDNASFTGANRLYPRFGFNPYRHEYVYEKTLRPGMEWRKMVPGEDQEASVSNARVMT